MKRLSTLLLAMVATAASAAIYPSSDWFGTNVQKQTTAAGVRAALGITSTGGSATNVYFTAGQSTTPRTVGGSNTFDVVGTLTNSTIGSAALATNAINATNLFGQISADHVDLSALLDIGVLYNNAGGMDAYSLGELGSLVSPYLTNALGSGFSDGFNKGTTGRLIAEFSNFSLDNAGFLWVNGLGINDDSSSLTNIPSKWFTSIAAMTNIAGVANQVVYVDSYFGSNVWGGGKFRWDNTSETINGGTIFAANGGGRWKRFDTGYPTNFYFMEWFGVVPNAAIDQYAGAQACINATPSDLGSCILPPYGFAVGTSLTWTNRKGCYFGALNSMKTKSSGYRVFPYPVSTIHWMGVSGGTNLVCYDVGHNTFAGFGLDTRIGLNNGDQWTNAAGLLMDVDMYPTHSTTTSANVFDGIYFRERGTNTTLVGQRIASYNWQNCEFFRWYDCYWQGGGWNLPEYWVTTTNLGASKGIQLGGNGGGQNSFQHYMFNCGWDRWMYDIHSTGGNWEIDSCKSTAAGAAAFYLNGDHPSIIRFADCEGDRQFLISPGDTVQLVGNRIADAVQAGYTNLPPIDAVKLLAYGNYLQHEAYIPSLTNSFNSTGSYDGAGNSFDTTNDALIASWRFNSAFNSRGDFGTLKDHNNIQSGPWKTPSALQGTNIVYQTLTDSATFPVMTLMSSNGGVAIGGYINNVVASLWNKDYATRVHFQIGDPYRTDRFNLTSPSSGARTMAQLKSDDASYLQLSTTNTRVDFNTGFGRNSIVFVQNYGEIVGTNNQQLVYFGTDYKIKFPYDTNFEVVGPIQGNSVRVTNFFTLFTNDNQAGISAAPTRYGQMTHFNSNGVEHVKVATTSGTLAWASTNIVPLTSAQVVGKFTGTPTGSLFLRDDGTLAAPSVGGVAWGAISGTLSSQTDLENRLVGTTNAGNLAFLDAPNQFSKTNAFDALRATNLNQGASSAIVGWNSESKLLTTNSVTLPGSKVDLSAYSDTYLLYNNAGGIDVLPQSTFLSTPLGVTNNATLSSGFLVGGDGARGVTNVAVGSGLSLSGGTLSATSTGGGGFGTNTAAASSWTNSANHVWSGNNTFTSTLIAGSLQSTLDGSATIWDHTSFAGASAGQELFDAFAIAGNKVFGIQSQPNDVQQPTNIFFRVDYPTKQKYGLGSFATNYIANANTAGYTNSRAAPGIGGTNNMVARVVGTSGTLEFYNRSGEYGVTVCGVGVFTNTISSSTWHIPIPVNSGFIIRSGVGVDIQVYAQ